MSRILRSLFSRTRCPLLKILLSIKIGTGGSACGRYYNVHKIENGAPVSVLHDAPLRLRCENELGFRQVKWIEAIEFVSDFAHLGAGQGGYYEDHEFYGNRMPI